MEVKKISVIADFVGIMYYTNIMWYYADTLVDSKRHLPFVKSLKAV